MSWFESIHETLSFHLSFRISRSGREPGLCLGLEGSKSTTLAKGKMRKEDWLVLLCIVRRRTFVKLALTVQCLVCANNALKKNQEDRNLQTNTLNWKAEISQSAQ